jgi:hypothetical protein
MTSKTNIDFRSAGAERERKTWDRPRLTRLRAGEAEIGANPAKPELHFAYGS